MAVRSGRGSRAWTMSLGRRRGHTSDRHGLRFKALSGGQPDQRRSLLRGRREPGVHVFQCSALRFACPASMGATLVAGVDHFGNSHKHSRRSGAT